MNLLSNIIQMSNLIESTNSIATVTTITDVNQKIPFSEWMCRADKKNEEKLNIIKSELTRRADELVGKAERAKTIEEFSIIFEKLDKIEREFILALGSTVLALPCFYIPGFDPLKTHREIVLSYFDDFVPAWYKLSVDPKLESFFMSKIRYDYFLKLEMLYNKKNVMTSEEFYRIIKKRFNDTKIKNIIELLKYSHSLILETIKFCEDMYCSCYDIIFYSKQMCMYVEQKISNKN